MSSILCLAGVVTGMAYPVASFLTSCNCCDKIIAIMYDCCHGNNSSSIPELPIPRGADALQLLVKIVGSPLVAEDCTYLSTTQEEPV